MYKVVLVDDEQPALEGLKLAIDWEGLGYQICGVCAHGEEAADLIEKTGPDLVLTDIRMPGLDGLGLIKRVKSRMPTIPKFIIISGYGEFDYARQALRLGIKHYLLKPVFPEDLIEVLASLAAPGAPAETAIDKLQAMSLPPPAAVKAPALDSPTAVTGAVLREPEPLGAVRVKSETNLPDPGSLCDEIAYLNTIIEALEDLDPERLETAIESAFTYFGAIQPPPEILKMYVINIIYHSIGLINEKNGAPAALLEKYNLNRADNKPATPQELKCTLQSYCAECCGYLKSLKDRDSQINIYKIEEYLRENFQRNLTLKEIARNFYMHPAYVGQLFIKKLGISFNEYLHKMRIEAAKRLMDGSALKTYEIAMEVGYNNYHCFLQNFEKYAGVKPAEYKKSRPF
ncbi:MAG: response regulator [Firmicutes bacterium]|nr:response regulator [Bacillota bacterium]